MLLQNNTQVTFGLNVKLTFDNGTTKVGSVKEGDYLLLKFLYNGEKLMRACQVTTIQPVQLDTQPISYAASLIVDCSTKFNAERLRISAKDILNIRFVDKDFIDALAPDYEITEDMINKDAIPSTPEKLYQTSGVGVAGVDEARILR